MIDSRQNAMLDIASYRHHVRRRRMSPHDRALAGRTHWSSEF